MATDVNSYVKALTAYRDDREEEWVNYFAQTTVEASGAARDFGNRLHDLQEKWRQDTQARRNSTAEKIIDLLPVQPVIDIPTAARLAKVSEEASRGALNTLESRGVVEQVTKRSWGRVWEAKGLWNLLDRFEQSLATPAGKRRLARPAPKTR